MMNISATTAATMDFDKAGEKLSSARAAIGEVFLGQTQVVDEVMVTLLAGGHGLQRDSTG